ncbi:hypothetical protein, partial [Bacillus sp. S1-R4H1-FB]|uniref:hypothetical protein n=1 Tax=Bacillus sp. S1-R4H1-FB TaxID=1973492 RepID=UPI001C54F7AE
YFSTSLALRTYYLSEVIYTFFLHALSLILNLTFNLSRYIKHMWLLQAEEGIRDNDESRGIGDEYKRKVKRSHKALLCSNWS